MTNFRIKSVGLGTRVEIGVGAGARVRQRSLTENSCTLRVSGSLLSYLGVGPPGVLRRELPQDAPDMAPVLQAEPRRGQPVGGTSGPRYLPHWSHIFPTLERSRSEKCSSNYPHAWQAIITTSATWRPLQLLVKTYSLLTILCAITANYGANQDARSRALCHCFDLYLGQERFNLRPEKRISKGNSLIQPAGSLVTHRPTL